MSEEEVKDFIKQAIQEFVEEIARQAKQNGHHEVSVDDLIAAAYK